MHLLNFWKKLIKASFSAGRQKRACDRHTPLFLEHLEDRTVPAQLLPDLLPLASQSAGYVHDWYLDTTSQPGRTLLRLSNAIANIGTGALELRGGETHPNNTQTVHQRIFDDAGGYTDTEAGLFVYHPEHSHIHFEDFAEFNLLQVTAGDGVGAPVASGHKISFCVEDVAAYNTSLPGAPASPQYRSCGQIQGISPGYADVYRANLPGQYIDITGIAGGTYWLESVADPEDNITESDETNNKVRIKITIGGAGAGDYAGNTLATARNIGALSTSQNFQDWVSPTDTNDYYRFTVGAGTFNLRLDGLSGNADVRLLNSSGTVLVSAAATGINPDVIKRTMTAGTYYVRVVPSGSANTPYTLSMAGASNIVDAAGNTLGTARDIGALLGTQMFLDAVNSSDANDYYHFRVADSTNAAFTLTMNGMTANANVRLLDEFGVLIASSAKTGTAAETITRTLEPGHAYYVHVTPVGTASTAYTLTLKGAPAAVVDGAGNTLATARNIGTLTAEQHFHDAVSPADVNDYYKFTVASSATFHLELEQLTADADVQLLSSTGAVLAGSDNSGTTAEEITQTLAAGTYYVRVFPYASASTSYELHLSMT